mmetsp:Transcript_35183/g.95392  ORF Transcript_35183/g.95392 Transcript_35183/m.95392 type:complete len:159 (-) Transcript_35183:2353-2829(-)
MAPSTPPGVDKHPCRQHVGRNHPIWQHTRYRMRTRHPHATVTGKRHVLASVGTLAALVEGLQRGEGPHHAHLEEGQPLWRPRNNSSPTMHKVESSRTARSLNAEPLITADSQPTAVESSRTMRSIFMTLSSNVWVPSSAERLMQTSSPIDMRSISFIT